jgi:hypothetical protein
MADDIPAHRDDNAVGAATEQGRRRAARVNSEKNNSDVPPISVSPSGPTGAIANPAITPTGAITDPTIAPAGTITDPPIA